MAITMAGCSPALAAPMLHCVDHERRCQAMDHEPIRCMLEMDADANISVAVQPGCSVADVHDMLRLLTRCGGEFGHLTVVDVYQPMSLLERDLVAAGGVHVDRAEQRVVIRAMCEGAVLDRLAAFVRDHYWAIRPIRNLRWGPHEAIPDPGAAHGGDVRPVFVVTMEFAALGAGSCRPGDFPPLPCTTCGVAPLPET